MHQFLKRVCGLRLKHISELQADLQNVASVFCLLRPPQQVPVALNIAAGLPRVSASVLPLFYTDWQGLSGLMPGVGWSTLIDLALAA